MSDYDEHTNKRTFLFGPSFSSKTCLMLKFPSRMPDQEFYIVAQSPLEEYANSKIKIKKLREKIRPLNEYENHIKVFDDILSTSKSK